MYRSLVTDEDSFNRKVRREKNATLNKLMKEQKKIIKNAKDKGLNTKQLSKKELKKQAEQSKRLRNALLKESHNDKVLGGEMSKEELAAYNAKIAEQNKMY